MKISDLHNASDELIFALKYSNKAKARDVYKIGPLTKRTFYEVKELQRLLFDENGFNQAILFVMELSKQKDPELFEFFAFFNYCKEEIENINEMEGLALAYTPSVEEEKAGIDRFGRFGYLMAIDSLSGGDVLKWPAIRDLQYEIAFSKLVIDKEKSDFDRALFKVQNPKAR